MDANIKCHIATD